MADRVSRTWVVAIATPIAVVLPLWTTFSRLFDAFDIGSHDALVSVALGAMAMMALLTLPAVTWAAVVAHEYRADRGAVTRATLRTALPLAVLVGAGVDLSQLLIDVVGPWHPLAVHGLFTLAFAVGLAVFLGTVSGRVAQTLRSAIDANQRASISRRVATSTVVGVVVGAVAALPLGWEVRPWMGMRMLKPLYLVVVTGSTLGGLALARGFAGVVRQADSLNDNTERTRHVTQQSSADATP